jgi:hypothetical protein
MKKTNKKDTMKKKNLKKDASYYGNIFIIIMLGVVVVFGFLFIRDFLSIIVSSILGLLVIIPSLSIDALAIIWFVVIILMCKFFYVMVIWLSEFVILAYSKIEELLRYEITK